MVIKRINGDNISNGGKKIVIEHANINIETTNKLVKSPLLISNGRNKVETCACKINFLSMPEVDINWPYNQIILQHFVMRRCRYYNSQRNISLKKVISEVEKPSRFRNIILTGMAGVGKTTVLKWLYANSYAPKCNYIYFTAKMFMGISSLEEVCEKIDSHLTTDEQCVIFFDGLDELQCIKGDSGELEAFLSFFERKSGGVSPNSKNRFVISTRSEHFAFNNYFKRKQATKNSERYVVFEIMPLNYHEALDICLSIKYLSDFDRKQDFCHFLDKWPNRKVSSSTLYSLSESDYKKQLKRYLLLKANETNFLLSIPLLCRYAYQIICDWTETGNNYTSQNNTLSEQIESVLRSYIKWEFHDENNISTKSEEGLKKLKKYNCEVLDFLTKVASLMNNNEFIVREQWSELKINYTTSLNSALCVLQENNDGELMFIHKSFKNFFLSRYYIQINLNKKKNKKDLKSFMDLIHSDSEFCVFYAEGFIMLNTTLSSDICKAIAETSQFVVDENFTEILVKYLTGIYTLKFKNEFPFTIEQYFHVFPCGKVLYGGEIFTLSRLEEIRKTKIIETDNPEYFAGCNLSTIMRNLNLSGIMYSPKYADEFQVCAIEFYIYFNSEIICVSGYNKSPRMTPYDVLKTLERREGLLDTFRDIQKKNLNATKFVCNQILSSIRSENGYLEKLALEHNKMQFAISSIVDFLGQKANYWCFFDGSTLFVCEISRRNSHLFSEFFFKHFDENHSGFYFSMLGEYLSQIQDENIIANSMAFISIEKIVFKSIFDFEVKTIFDPRNLLYCYFMVHWKNIRIINKKLSLDFEKKDYIMDLNFIENVYKTVEELLKKKSNDKLRLIISDEMLITYYISEQTEKLIALASETLAICRVFDHNKGEQLRLLFIDNDAIFSNNVKSIVEDFAKNNIWFFYE